MRVWEPTLPVSGGGAGDRDECSTVLTGHAGKPRYHPHGTFEY